MRLRATLALAVAALGVGLFTSTRGSDDATRDPAPAPTEPMYYIDGGSDWDTCGRPPFRACTGSEGVVTSGGWRITDVSVTRDRTE